MAGRSDGLTVCRWLLGVLAAVWPSDPPAAQVAPNRAATYLHPTDVRDARAIWVNPAGLGVLREASVYAEVSVSKPGARGRLEQLNAGFNARGLAFAYQRDQFDSGERGHTYRIGLAGAAEALAAGAAIAHYRGTGAKATGWDLGATYHWRPSVTVGAVVANIGQPDVRGVELPLTMIPGVTLRPLGGVALSAQALATTDSVAAYAFGLAWRAGLGGGRWPLEVIARLDTDGGLRRGAFAFGISIGGQDRVGVIATTPGDVSGIEAASIYGVATRKPLTRR